MYHPEPTGFGQPINLINQSGTQKEIFDADVMILCHEDFLMFSGYYRRGVHTCIHALLDLYFLALLCFYIVLYFYLSVLFLPGLHNNAILITAYCLHSLFHSSV